MANKTFQSGPSNSGKTVLLAVMANQFTAGMSSENGFFLLPTGLDDSNELADLYEGMTEKGIFPKGTLPGTRRSFNFQVYYDDSEGVSKEVPQLNFSIVDYAGEDITDGKREIVNELRDDFNKADQQIIVIDGFALLNHFEIANFGDLNLGDRRFSKAKFTNMLTRSKTQNKKVAIVVTKCDYVTKYISNKELIRKIKEKFNNFLPIGTVIIPVSSTGIGVTEDEIIIEPVAKGDDVVNIHRLVGKVTNSELNPLNVDVLLSFIFTQFIQREQKKLKEEIGSKIDKIESDARMDTAAMEREIQKQIEDLSRIPNSSIGRVFSSIFEKFKKTTGIGETKEEKIRKLRRELANEIERIGKEKGVLKARYENDPELKKYAEILDSVNQKYRKFIEDYPEALIIK